MLKKDFCECSLTHVQGESLLKTIMERVEEGRERCREEGRGSRQSDCVSLFVMRGSVVGDGYRPSPDSF